MESKYKWNENPIQDFFLQLIIDDVDISKKKNINEIREWLVNFIQEFLINRNDIIYLDFNIKKDSFENYKIISNNIITALWFKGIIPTNIDDVLKKNKLIYNKNIYSFNNKTKLLTIKKINK